MFIPAALFRYLTARRVYYGDGCSVPLDPPSLIPTALFRYFTARRRLFRRRLFSAARSARLLFRRRLFQCRSVCWLLFCDGCFGAALSVGCCSATAVSVPLDPPVAYSGDAVLLPRGPPASVRILHGTQDLRVFLFCFRSRYSARVHACPDREESGRFRAGTSFVGYRKQYEIARVIFGRERFFVYCLCRMAVRSLNRPLKMEKNGINQ
ncbi:MAG: hypothetical protein IJJ85_03385 [Clostridia bacterium]|nr:hypothetical protein [Clostridia bacterium]